MCSYLNLKADTHFFLIFLINLIILPCYFRFSIVLTTDVYKHSKSYVSLPNLCFVDKEIIMFFYNNLNAII